MLEYKEALISKTNALGAAAVTLFASLLGEYWYLFAAFLALNFADYISGIVKAKFTNSENSAKGAEGIIKKVGYWVVIAIAFFMAVTFEKLGCTIGVDLGFTELIGWFTLATFIINEIRSVLENLITLGVNVPSFLIKGLEAAANAVDSRADGE